MGATISRNLQAAKKAIIYLAEVLELQLNFSIGHGKLRLQCAVILLKLAIATLINAPASQ
jgi:hypothetical protein